MISRSRKPSAPATPDGRSRQRWLRARSGCANLASNPECPLSGKRKVGLNDIIEGAKQTSAVSPAKGPTADRLFLLSRRVHRTFHQFKRTS
jgi:hypothetical protein